MLESMVGKEKFFSREIEDKILPFLNRDEIIIIRGPRQAGKTALLNLLSEKISGKKEFVDLDLPKNRKDISESPLDYVKRIAGNGKVTLFFDEIQRLENAGEILKIIYDAFKGWVKILASGSSSLEIRQKILGYLVGRAVVFDLYTFGFGEFIRTKDEGLYKVFKERKDSILGFVSGISDPIPPAFSEDMLNAWKEYLIYGGYPEIVKAESKQLKETLLSNLVDLYIEKDIVSFFKIEDTREFEKFAKSIAFNDSQMLLLSSIASDAGISIYKAKQYLSIIENTYIAKTVYPYFKNEATSIKKTPKLYFLDLGMRNAVLKNFSTYDQRDDAGKLAENFVFRELHAMGKEVKYWRSKGGAEMDFVLEEADGIVPIEVKLGGSKALGKSFYSFIKAYKPKRALVLTLNGFSRKAVNGTAVYSVPIFYL